MATIKLNVGGTVFETTKDSLKNSTYLTSFVERWTKPNEVIFIDRSPETFKHVISLLRDFNYPFPDEYLYELDFYGIKYTDTPRENKMDKLFDMIDGMQKKLDKLIVAPHKCTNCPAMLVSTDTCLCCTKLIEQGAKRCTTIGCCNFMTTNNYGGKCYDHL